MLAERRAAVTACRASSLRWQPAHGRRWKNREPDDDAIPIPADDSAGDTCLLHRRQLANTCRASSGVPAVPKLPSQRSGGLLPN